ncbi:FtsK/SpoIIIE domain-containing protein [Actinomycetospora succinea]|nr:FtsK/SpoIIIE domain-containing protein [Actinomycetospora succinea]
MAGLAVVAGWLLLTTWMPWGAALALVAVVIAVLAAVPALRRCVSRRAMATMTRHRLRQVLVERRCLNFSRAAPLFLWSHPTEVGETVWLLLRAGISPSEVEGEVEWIASGCFARDARVTPTRRMTALVKVDVIRRDPLACELIASELDDWTATTGEAPPRGTGSFRRRRPTGTGRALGTEPVRRSPLRARRSTSTTTSRWSSTTPSGRRRTGPRCRTVAGTGRTMSEPTRLRALLRDWVTAVRTPAVCNEAPAPSVLSIWDPIHLGVDEYGRAVRVTLAYRNALLAGEPGAGKSVGLNCIVGHAALATDCGLWLFDGKLVELGLWRTCAERFVGPDLDDAIDALGALQGEMDRRYELLDTERRRKITPDDAVHGIEPVVVVLDEVAYYSATVGTKTQREAFSVGVRDLVARGRAAGIIVVAATQRPSSDIIPTSLRDLFGYRWAFRCTTDSSSDIVLGAGWATRGHTAADIAPEDKGVGLLLAEGGEPRRIKSAYLSDEQVYALADHATGLRARDAA